MENSVKKLKTGRYDTKPNATSFKKGHPALKGEPHPQWKENNAGYGVIADLLQKLIGKYQKKEADVQKSQQP